MFMCVHAHVHAVCCERPVVCVYVCDMQGFMWSAAPEYSAMVVFAEHRYYGKSLPFGPDSFNSPTHLAYLTSEQALADFVELISFLQSKHGPVPVVAFGGSYGGDENDEHLCVQVDGVMVHVHVCVHVMLYTCVYNRNFGWHTFDY